MFSAVQTLLSLLTVRHNFYTKENIDEFDNLQTIFQYHLIILTMANYGFCRLPLVLEIEVLCYNQNVHRPVTLYKHLVIIVWYSTNHE